MVVSFDSDVETVCDLTSDTDKLGRAIRELHPGGGTAMYDAISFASKGWRRSSRATNFAGSL